jgi:DNA polymerase
MTCGKVDLECTKCRLSRERTQVVPGFGRCGTTIVFIGEAPGRDEDLAGKPFVGRAGRALDSAFEKCGISRSRVYITNVVKCRPPGNRKPREDEAMICSQYLFSELERIRPSVICILGRTAAALLLSEKSVMSILAKEEFEMIIAGRRVRAFVTYHPAACLYQKKHLKRFEEGIRCSLEAAGLI